MPKTRFVDTLSPGDLLGAGFTFVEKHEDQVSSSGNIKVIAKFRCPHCNTVNPHSVTEIKDKSIRSCGCLKKGGKLRAWSDKTRAYTTFGMRCTGDATVQRLKTILDTEATELRFAKDGVVQTGLRTSS